MSGPVCLRLHSVWGVKSKQSEQHTYQYVFKQKSVGFSSHFWLYLNSDGYTPSLGCPHGMNTNMHLGFYKENAFTLSLWNIGLDEAQIMLHYFFFSHPNPRLFEICKNNTNRRILTGRCWRLILVCYVGHDDYVQREWLRYYSRWLNITVTEGDKQ